MPEKIGRSKPHKTLRAPVTYSGVGIHTGQEVQMRLCPAKAGQGIFFQRVDLPGKPIIPATIEYVFDTSRSTNLALGDVRIYTVEHVLAALRAYDIDTLCIELNNVEPPAGNGSSDVFVSMIEEAGVQELSSNHQFCPYSVLYTLLKAMCISLRSHQMSIASATRSAIPTLLPLAVSITRSL